MAFKLPPDEKVSPVQPSVASNGDDAGIYGTQLELSASKTAR